MVVILMSDKFTVKSRLTDYEVFFIDNFPTELCRVSKEKSIILIDQNVFDIYREEIKSVIPEESIILIEAIEHNKTIDYCKSIIEILLTKDIRRNYSLIAVGGGIIQDITAFTASILFRGVKWIFFPTTLLAQADSCIGSKTSINMNKYKNLLGNFYPPSQIFINVDFLKDLPSSAIKSGIGEMLHFYLQADYDLAKRLIDNYDGLLSSPDRLKEYVFASLMIKKKVIEIDEFDKNERNLFNYGHTFGHAIESISDYSVPHGQAVTMGMDIANYLSLKLGLLNKLVFEGMHKILSKNIPSFRIREEMIDAYLKALSRDKKNVDNNFVCILTRGPCSMEKVQIPFDINLRNLILSYVSNAS
jgi:3-dehydroquinate synthase